MFGGDGTGLVRPHQLDRDRGDQSRHDHRDQHVVAAAEDGERIVLPQPEAALPPVEQAAEPEVDTGKGEKHRARHRQQEETRRDGVGAEEAEEGQASLGGNSRLANRRSCPRTRASELSPHCRMHLEKLDSRGRGNEPSGWGTPEIEGRCEAGIHPGTLAARRANR